MPPLHRRIYDGIRDQIEPLIEKHGPSVALIVALDVCQSRGMTEQARVIAEACDQLGVSFAVQYVASNSNPSKSYKVTKFANGELGCECHGWIYCTIPNKWSDTEKSCSHTRKAAKQPENWVSEISLPTAATPVIAVKNNAGSGTASRRIVFASEQP